MNVAIVHRDKNITKLLEFILSDCGCNIVWCSDSGSDTIHKCQQNKPDLILIQNILGDISCPVLISRIMKDTPTTIIVVTESISENPGSIFEAMSAGALDAIVEPDSNNKQLILELKIKIQNIYSLQTGSSRSDRLKNRPSVEKRTDKAPLVAIGSSTGGPAALVKVLKNLPETIPISIVIIQHLDSHFSQGMAKWLNDQIILTVKLAQAGQTPLAGIVYLASTNDHLILNTDSVFEYISEPIDYPYRPSVDVFFSSVLSNWSPDVMGILLTGMGKDGANGLLSFHQHNKLTVAQNKESCAVYGMPKAAIECNAAEEICHVDDISKHITNFMKGF